MECENAERPRILGRAIATATVTAGQDDLYHPDSFAPDEPPTFAPQQFRLRTGDPEALGPPRETIEVPAPETGYTPAYGKGLEQSVAILETTVGNAQAVGLDPIDQHSQRQYRKPRTDLYQTRCARVYSRHEDERALGTFEDDIDLHLAGAVGHLNRGHNPHPAFPS